MLCSNCGTMLTCPSCNANEIQRLNQTIQDLKTQSQRKQIITIFISIPISIALYLVINLDIVKPILDYITGTKIKTEQQDSPARIEPTRIEPNSHFVAGEFNIKDPLREINFRVDVECQNCTDRTLTMLLMNEDNYRNYKGGRGYLPIHHSDNILTFVYDGKLQIGHYYIVFNNSSSHIVLAKIRTNLTFK